MPVTPDAAPHTASLSKEQVQLLLNMLGTNKSSGECMAGKSSSLLWIIDTGVLHHVIGDASCLSHINHVTDCPVGLPNGSRALTTLAGSVTFPGGVVLHHMLYVPQLT